MIQGFTDHDRDVIAERRVCRADTGFAGSEAAARLGLSVDGSEVSGALSDDSLNEDALAAGRYDAAQVDMYIVDWSEPSLHVLMSRGHIGEVRREGMAFAPNCAGLPTRSMRRPGGSIPPTCSADLGDARCGVDLDDPAVSRRGRGDRAERHLDFHRDRAVEDFDDGWFTGRQADLHERRQ